MYYVYLLLSDKDGKFYTGSTDDLKRRIAEHEAGYVKSTVRRKPLKLIYYEACLNEADAGVRERYLKSGTGKKYLRNRLRSYLINDGDDPIAFFIVGTAESWRKSDQIFSAQGQQQLATGHVL